MGSNARYLQEMFIESFRKRGATGPPTSKILCTTLKTVCLEIYLTVGGFYDNKKRKTTQNVIPLEENRGADFTKRTAKCESYSRTEGSVQTSRTRSRRDPGEDEHPRERTCGTVPAPDQGRNSPKSPAQVAHLRVTHALTCRRCKRVTCPYSSGVRLSNLATRRRREYGTTGAPEPTGRRGRRMRVTARARNHDPANE
ncbi:hypothetical protein EVAR_40932_1 [Eumeta japonica]|uniref:Uncharacterized protein n=1 Tax=Eumeta variegata TaxID=151549 RepID=A0A4C1X5E0_EUMVA|nr:hypothetical protein EVAR_40932_1 [Eumeta japonica]